MWLVGDTVHLFPFNFQAKMRGVVCSLTTLSVSVSYHAGCNLIVFTIFQGLQWGQGEQIKTRNMWSGMSPLYRNLTHGTLRKHKSIWCLNC